MAAALLLALAFAAPASAYEETDSYQAVTIQGFDVLVSAQVRAHPSKDLRARRLLDGKLKQIVRFLRPKRLAVLRQVRFWVEWKLTDEGATYHPSGDWLSHLGYNPEKNNSVEISNLEHFLTWAQTDQPMMVLHELSHAYHHLALGYDYAPIKEAYQNALDRHLYESVPYVHGGKKRAYALTNEKEFFAELTEAYFGRNDFYPFTRSDLKAYDPVGYALMQAVWQ